MKKLFFLLVLLSGMLMAKAQQVDLVKYKSLFTINFIRYVEWPGVAKEGNFVIGVLKSSAVANELKTQTSGKKIGYQNIEIKEFKNAEEITNCQILYVDASFNYSKYADIVGDKLNKNSLIITDDGRAIASGSMINFVIVNNQLKFEISPSNTEKSGLKLSSALFSMNNAIKV